VFKSQFENIEFAYPWLLTLLIILPLVIWWHIKKNEKNRAAIAIPTTKYFRAKKTLKVRLCSLLFLIRCIALLAIIIALARPQKKSSIQYLDGEGIDIMLCLDVSSSMEALDFEPNRMQVSKQMAQNFVRNRFGDRVGVVVFSSSCYTLCPLTTDTNAVVSQLSTIQFGAFPTNDASVINSSIASCVGKLKGSKVKTKIIILISDGVVRNDYILTEEAIKLSKKYNIKIYTIGVGTTNDVPVNISLMKDGVKISESIKTKSFGYNESLLKQLAQETGGKYFYAADNEVLAKVYQDINQLEKSDIQMLAHNNFADKY
jgi:Ca-activated chloride channel family protein